MKNAKIVVGVCATRRYTYALPNFSRRLFASIYESRVKSGHIVFVGDTSEEIDKAYIRHIKGGLPDGWTSELVCLNVDDNGLKNYKQDAQFLIAKLQGRLFQRARQLDADYFWSLESDVLVANNALRVSLDSLKYDNNYYDVCMCTYPSQGGGSYLGGFGAHDQHIYEDHLVEERDVPKKTLDKYHKIKEKLDKLQQKPTQKQLDEWTAIRDEVKKFPPKENVFALNGKKWRKRGWMEYAYPAIGRGALVPTDWVGFGCTLMSRKALSLAHFDGYQGNGTQDLYVCWTNWYPNDIKLCVSTHSICDHIIRNRDGEEQKWDEFTHVRAYHELHDDYKGHLRQEYLPFHTHDDE